MRKIAADAGSLPHFAEWISPIWKALPNEYKDGFFARGRAATRAKELGIEVDGVGQARFRGLVLVASFEDHRRAGKAQTVLINHGCGQQYVHEGEGHPSYTGGRDRDRVVLHICPSEADAARNRATGTPAVAAGPCRLDDWYNGVKQRPSNDRPVVAISFHADVHVVPETRSAFSHYQAELIRLAKDPNRPFDLLGHGHPRWGEFMAKFWKRVGVPFARHFDEVLEKADCYVIDNSSTGPEFASTGRPVLWLNAPWYRKDVHHGGRFWEWAGAQVDDPAHLLPAIKVNLNHQPSYVSTELTKMVYGDLCDGQATTRAVTSIVGLLDAS